MLALVLLAFIAHGQARVHAERLLAWETHLVIGHVERPLGLVLNRSSLAHQHFATGYLCLQSFMYDEAQEAFDRAINTTPTFIEARIGKILGYNSVLSLPRSTLISGFLDQMQASTVVRH
jgi:hypothetical protein